MAIQNRTNDPQKEFLRPKDVVKIYSISLPTIHRWIKNGEMPAPRKINQHVIGWQKSVLDTFFFGEPEKHA